MSCLFSQIVWFASCLFSSRSSIGYCTSPAVPNVWFWYFSKTQRLMTHGSISFQSSGLHITYDGGNLLGYGSRSHMSRFGHMQFLWVHPLPKEWFSRVHAYTLVEIYHINVSSTWVDLFIEYTSHVVDVPSFWLCFRMYTCYILSSILAFTKNIVFIKYGINQKKQTTFLMQNGAHQAGIRNAK